MTTALFFPGQGSQSVGMLGELADEFGIERDVRTGKRCTWL